MTTHPGHKNPYVMQFDTGTIKHLGLQMYSTLPPVVGELVANSWDANASRVEIIIPETALDPFSCESKIVIRDDGIGMSDEDVRNKYIIIGRDRRDSERTDESPEPLKRKIMGRKGIGKMSSFGVAKEIEIESVKDGETSRFVMNYDRMMAATDRSIEFDALPETGKVTRGTQITLRKFTKFNTKPIPIGPLRRRLARRFSVIGIQNGFEVSINGTPISPDERDLKRLLDIDADGCPYIWEYDNERICEDAEWRVSGWIGALDRTSEREDGVDRGITLMARGKLVREPFVFNAPVGQQYALSYIVGELHVEFVDEAEDTISTNRNDLVWDTEANEALKEWGQKKVNDIAREWAERRGSDNRKKLEQSPLYLDFRTRADEIGSKRASKLVDRLVRQAISTNPVAKADDFDPIIETALDFLEFDAFREIAEDISEANLNNIPSILNLFQEWQIVEAKEMAGVMEGRISTIEKFQNLIETNALEVPTIHNFLKEFPWIIDPRWTLIADEAQYSSLLKERFPESPDTPEPNKRIDFLCVSETDRISVVEIKRPGAVVSVSDFAQIEHYVGFMKHIGRQSTDPDYRYESVKGYLVCGQVANTWEARDKQHNLEQNGIYVRLYSQLLTTVRNLHKDFIDRYNELREAKSRRMPQ